ncbi:MAG: hypothetical protein M0Z66_04800 [Thermaerobacter sp.]|nr:hypothetical protein [Thermaerobacter sp.]
MNLVDVTADGCPPKRSDRWAVRVLWIVLVASVGFGAWSYVEGGLPYAVT